MVNAARAGQRQERMCFLLFDRGLTVCAKTIATCCFVMVIGSWKELSVPEIVEFVEAKDNTVRNMFVNVASQNGPANGASQHGARDRHRAQWCMCASSTCFTLEADPAIAREEKPVDTDKTGDWHMATQIVLYVSGRTTDVSRTVPIYESYSPNHAIFAWVAEILQSTS